MKIISGFTIAEVLITLLIIGVVSSLVIPSLINDIQDMHYKVAYKKAFAMATQALSNANKDYLLISSNAWSDASNDNNFYAFKNQFNVTISCDRDNAKCWTYNPDQRFLGLYPQTNAPSFVDNSGIAWSRTGPGGGLGFEILVDINGLKDPNVYGKDRFFFSFLPRNGTYPDIPTKVKLAADYPNSNSACPSGGCYYRSWISQ